MYIEDESSAVMGNGICGGVAQLGERSVRIAEAIGSIPFTSTNFL